MVGNPKNNDFINSTAEIMMDSLNQKNYPWPFLVATEGFNTHSSEPNHKKLVIIDGLLAFKGSANLSINAWTKASKTSRSEHIEVTSHPEEVAMMNNEHFSPLWKENRGIALKYV